MRRYSPVLVDGVSKLTWFCCHNFRLIKIWSGFVVKNLDRYIRESLTIVEPALSWPTSKCFAWFSKSISENSQNHVTAIHEIIYPWYIISQSCKAFDILRCTPVISQSTGVTVCDFQNRIRDRNFMMQEPYYNLGPVYVETGILRKCSWYPSHTKVLCKFTDLRLVGLTTSWHPIA